MSKTDELAKAYSGLLGDQVVVKRGRKGKNVMTLAKPRSKGVPTEKQLASRERMSLAAVYAKRAKEDPALWEMYTQRSRKGLPTFRVAANDFLQLPFLRNIDTSGYFGNPGDSIRATAGDKIGLTEVKARLQAPDGTLVEEGPCVLDLPTGIYAYVATIMVADITGITVIITVRDIPGNVVRKSVTL